MGKFYNILKYKQAIKVVTLLLVLCFGKSWGQSIWSNPITGTNPNSANPYTTGQTVDPNITVSGIKRGSGIAGTNANDRYNATGWNSGSFDSNDYFEFTLNPCSGGYINFISFVYNAQASGTGPVSFAFRSSVDGFVANIGTPTAGGTTINLSAAAYQNITTPISFRIYGWGASASGGTWSINDFIFNGSTSCMASNAITTGLVNNPPFSLPSCTATASGTVAFTSSGTFNAGNNYTAQLSDASGSFASPVSIGSIASVANSGTVSITIPAGTASGTGYLIRIVSDNPVIIGSNSAVFTITTTCTPTITPGGTITACAFSGAMSIYDKCNNGQGCTSGCDLTVYSNLGYTMCDGSTFNGNCPTGQQLQGIVFNIPSGCTMNVTVEFKKRAGGCSNSGMDGGDYLKINGITYTGSGNADIIQSISQTGGSIFIEQSADRSEEILTFTASIVSGSCVQCSLLDVSLLNFNCVAESEGYKLAWATASEHNSQNFEIEYSIDGIHFTKIAEVQAKGESNSYLQYEKYIENVFSSPLVYFRLKMNDFSGRYTYSPIVYLQNDFLNSLTISPNPSLNDDVVVYLGKKIDYLNSTVAVFDVSGKQLVEQLISESQTVINTKNFSEGIYFLKISTPYKTQNYKLIIQK